MSRLSRPDAEAFLYHEARLLDGWQLEEWLTLFTSDGVYWVPIDDTKPSARNASIVNDPPLRREERVHHLLHTPFPAQSPRSRTIHMISNVEVTGDETTATVRSNQVVHEMRRGDFRQPGLGEAHMLVASVEHSLRREPAGWKIARKKILLIDRDMSLGNLTFLF